MRQRTNIKKRIAKLTNFGLLLGVILAWGFSWPMMKLSLIDIPPLWMAVLRMSIATVIMFAYLILTKKFAWPSMKDLPQLLSVGVLQMGIFSALINLGLMHVDAGRSAILAFTSPLWVVPITLLFFKESLSKLSILGLLFGFLGVMFLFNPFSFDWSNTLAIKGNGLLLLAALVWALVIIHIRYSKWHLSPLQLAPWQMLIAFVLLTILGFYFEPHPQIHWSLHLLGLMLYIGPIATAFGFWGVTEISKRLPAVTTSLGLLGVPVVGLLSSALILGNALTLGIVIALLFILVGLGFISLASQRAKTSLSTDAKLCRSD